MDNRPTVTFEAGEADIVETGKCRKNSVNKLQTEEWTLVNLHHCILQSNIGQSERIKKWTSDTNAFGRNFACYDKSSETQTQVFFFLHFTFKV